MGEETLENRILAKFVQESNLIEDIDYSYEETMVSIEDGRGPWEIVNHARAVRWAWENKHEVPRMGLINVLHSLLMNGLVPLAGVVRWVDVEVGTHKPPTPERLEMAIGEFDGFIEKTIKSEISPVDKAWSIHHFFECMHPYPDGNGRVGRVLLNWVLWHLGSDMEIIESKNRELYYSRIREWKFENWKE